MPLDGTPRAKRIDFAFKVLFVLLQPFSTRYSGAVFFKLSCVHGLAEELVPGQIPVQQVWGRQKSTFLTSS